METFQVILRLLVIVIVFGSMGLVIYGVTGEYFKDLNNFTRRGKR